jgi:DNA-binding MarR family transcriptional regulator
MPTDKPSPWQDTPPTAERVVALMSRIASVMRADAWRSATTEGLTPTQADLLALLATRPPGARLGWLAEQLSITSATTSDAVAALVTKGWVQKARAADDARALSLSLTRSGRALARRLAAPAGFVQSAAGALPVQAQDRLLSDLLKLVGELQRSEAFPELRTCVTCEHFEAHRHADASAPHHCHLVGAPLPARLLRVDCHEHVPASLTTQAERWQALRA